MKRIIKRYENRKMYDTENRKYISLEEIANLIREGVDVRVIDNATEKDITTQTLTQVILEEGKKGRNPFSTEILHGVIRWGNHVLDDGIKQVRQGLDQLMPESLNKLLAPRKSSELAELKERIASLEQTIRSFAEKAESQAEKKQKKKNQVSKSKNK